VKNLKSHMYGNLERKIYYYLRGVISDQVVDQVFQFIGQSTHFGIGARVQQEIRSCVVEAIK